MNVKLKKGDGDVAYYSCDHVAVRVNGPETPAVKLGLAPPGIIIELSPGPTIRLPQDGDSVFLLQGKDTIDAYHWPPRSRPARGTPSDAEAHTG